MAFDLLGELDELVQLLRSDRFRLPLGDKFFEALLKVRRKRGVNAAQQRRLCLRKAGGVPLGAQGDHLGDKSIQILGWQALDRAQKLLG